MSTKDSEFLTSAQIKNLVEQMGEAANNFLSSLSPDQRSKAQCDFGDKERRTFWHYTPILRDGLPLAEMEFQQRRLAHQLAATGVSRTGYVTVSTIIGLETTLDMIEGWQQNSWDRNPANYYTTIFGTPNGTEPWGWKFEGHHISLNYTIINGQIVAPTPTFFGSNPADAALNGVGALRPLGNVEDLARDLVHELNEEQRAIAILASEAPRDMLTRNTPAVVEEAQPMDMLENMAHDHFHALRYTEQPKGLSAATMSSSQQEILQSLVYSYINRMPDAIAEIEMAKLNTQGIDGVHMAWAGGIEKREGHYYRLQGLDFLVEYDNIQNDANHIHSVWRAPSNDFGADLLAHHYHSSHHSHTPHKH